MHCTVLHCTEMYCAATVLHCTALSCTALHCTVLHCPVLASRYREAERHLCLNNTSILLLASATSLLQLRIRLVTPSQSPGVSDIWLFFAAARSCKYYCKCAICCQDTLCILITVVALHPTLILFIFYLF